MIVKPTIYGGNTSSTILLFHNSNNIFSGDNPTPPKGTRVSLILSDKDEDKEWGAWILKNDKKKLSVRINTPPTCYVGIWKFQVETIQKSDQKKIVFEYTHDQDIYILFNPWCKGLSS